MMKKNLFVLIAILACLNVSAQDNGLNPVYKVQLGDITYQKSEASKKVTVGKVQKGGKEIKAAFDRGDAIVAISTD